MVAFVRQIAADHSRAVAGKAAVPAPGRKVRAAFTSSSANALGRTLRYIVCYDTPDDARRCAFSSILSAWGVRVQWSMFECTLSDRELSRLTRALDRVINPAFDDLRIFQNAATGTPTHPWLGAYVHQPNDYWVA